MATNLNCPGVAIQIISIEVRYTITGDFNCESNAPLLANFLEENLLFNHFEG